MKPAIRAKTPEMATPVTPRRGKPRSPKRSTQFPATLSRFWPLTTSITSRVCRCARSTAPMATLWASRNSVPPRMPRKGRA